MCGIVGYWDIKQTTAAQASKHIVGKMTNALVHRGPDDQGIWVDSQAGIALGHRRLSIIDRTNHGHQPMLSASGRYQLVFNGEIYNHVVLKQQLIHEQGMTQWHGHSDTEVLLAAFDVLGVKKTLQQLEGMFAIALWDTQAHLLYLMRDRIGEKPLYYGWLGQHLVFGSELKALKQHPAWQPSIWQQALALQMRYNYIPAPYTIYQDIYKVVPGHFLVINRDQSIHQEAYWKLSDCTQKTPAPVTDTVAESTLETELLRVVRQQMVADVPVGAFLSGGIDSSLIVALMQSCADQPVRTFTIGFEDQAYNEAEHAKAVAQHLGTEHTELYLSAAETRAVIPQLPSIYDEPFSDSSQIPTYIVSKLARQQVTVSLSGDGGDELFGGYNRYVFVSALWKKLTYFPKPLRILLAKLLMGIPPKLWDKLFAGLGPFLPRIAQQRHPGDKLHKLAKILPARSVQEIYQLLVSHWFAADAVVASPLVSIEGGPAQVTEQPLKGYSFIEHMMYCDMHSYLPDDLLVKVDRAAMAVSLETRMPFLDHRLIEYAWSLPLSVKIRSGKNKWLLRQLLYKYVPKPLIERPKMGFGVPIDQWLRGPLHEWASDLLSESMLSRHNLLDQCLIQKKWKEHVSGLRNWQYHLWDVLMFQAWYGEHYG